MLNYNFTTLIKIELAESNCYNISSLQYASETNEIKNTAIMQRKLQWDECCLTFTPLPFLVQLLNIPSGVFKNKESKNTKNVH